jgi:polar amino acid transport system substrate-binding protein
MNRTDVPFLRPADFAPTGMLRVAINLGNSVLARLDPGASEPAGISVDIARELARRIERPIRFITFDGAGKVFESADKDVWDIAFLAIDPVRATQIHFTPPYVLIEGAYLVPQDSALKSVDDVDRDGVRIAVGEGSAYDLFLTRTIKRASLVRAPTSAAAIEMFVRDKLDVAAGVKQPLAAYASGHAGVRLIPGRFMAIEQAMGLPLSHAAALPGLIDFIEGLKRSGFIAAAIERNHQPDALVAPPQGP